MFKWFKNLFTPTKEEQDFLKFLKALHKLYEEYDVEITPRGGMRKTSKPEYVEKHRKELAWAFPEILDEIRKKGYCKIKG